MKVRSATTDIEHGITTTTDIKQDIAQAISKRLALLLVATQAFSREMKTEWGHVAQFFWNAWRIRGLSDPRRMAHLRSVTGKVAEEVSQHTPQSGKRKIEE